MTRPLALLLAALLAPAAASPQQKPADAPAPDKPAPDRPAGKVSDDVKAAIQKEVDKAREEIREEMRQKLQDQQVAREALEGGAEKPRLELFTVDGYLRTRGDFLNNPRLKRQADPGGYALYPPPPSRTDKKTQTSANFRLRLEPTLNVSEQVRVNAQVDLLDGLLLGDNPQLPPSDGVSADRDSIRVKRAWGEVQTPVGLLSFGRMPSQWGLGIVNHAGGGLEDDLGTNADRVQLAIPVKQTFLGPLVLVPYWDWTFNGLQAAPSGAGLGQPVDLEGADDGYAVGLRVVRLDTADELARKTERGDSSRNYGVWYTWQNRSYVITPAVPTTAVPSPETDPYKGLAVDVVKRGAHQHRLDLWGRYQSRRLRLEVEAAGVYGKIGDARVLPGDPAIGPVQLRQFAAVFQGEFRPSEKLALGIETGIASGDPNPGLGNRPGRGPAQPGWIDGQQFTATDPALDIRNFQFDPAYRIDLLLWRELLGPVTDCIYVKPSMRYDIIEGLALKLALVYSQTSFSKSSPSQSHKPLGVEADSGLHYASSDGFHVWLDWGLLYPLDGLAYGPARPLGAPGLGLAHALRGGLAIRF